VTSVVATSVRVAAVLVVRAARAPSATVRGRSAAVMVIVRTVRMVTVRTVIVLRAIVLRVTAPMPIGRVRKASGSGRVVTSVTARRVIVRKAIVRVPSAIVRTARRVATALMVIARTAIVPASTVRKATAPRVIVRRVTVRARSAIVRMARRVATVRTVTARRAIAPMVIVPARTAAPVASAAGVAPLS
jgi:hypothetical protein